MKNTCKFDTKKLADELDRRRQVEGNLLFCEGVVAISLVVSAVSIFVVCGDTELARTWLVGVLPPFAILTMVFWSEASK